MPSEPQFETAAVPCRVCRRADHLTLPGTICFDCERQAAREVANDMASIYSYLEPRRRFTDWLIEQKRRDAA